MTHKKNYNFKIIDNQNLIIFNKKYLSIFRLIIFTNQRPTLSNLPILRKSIFSFSFNHRKLLIYRKGKIIVHIILELLNQEIKRQKRTWAICIKTMISP